MISLQFLQIRTQSFIGNVLQISLQLIEPYDPVFHQAVQDHHFMFSGNQRKRIAETRIFKVCILNILIYHMLSSKIVPVKNIST